MIATRRHRVDSVDRVTAAGGYDVMLMTGYNAWLVSIWTSVSVSNVMASSSDLRPR